MKSIYKLTPVSLYDMTGLEHWLDEMALQGLQPLKIGTYFTRFQPGPPAKVRFRLEATTQERGPDPAMLELYQDSGWDYVCPIARLYHLFRATDPAVPELHTDPVTRGHSLETLSRKVRQYRIHMFLLPLLLLFAIALPVLLLEWDFRTTFPGMDSPDYMVRLPLLLVELSSLAMFLPFLVWDWFRTLRHCRLLLNLHKQLSEGLETPPASPSGSWKWLNLGHLVLSILLCLTLICTVLLDRLPPTMLWGNTPYVSLYTLEEEPMVSYAQLYGASHFHDDENRIKHHPTILAPVYYEVEQEAYSLVPGSSPGGFSPDPEDGRYRYNPSLDAAYFKLLFPFMAKPVALAQMDTYRLLNVDWTYEELEHPGADFVLLAREEQGVWQMAALTKGSRGAVFQYSGQLDLAEHLDELAALVQ